MFLDCTLGELKVPGFSGVNPPFGTKKPDGQSVTAREADVNIRMAFTRQRPYHVGETSVTSAVEAHSAFVLEASDITLTLGAGAFVGCKARIFNAAEGNASVVFGSAEGETAALVPGESCELTWQDGVWKLPPKIDLGSATPYGFGMAREGRNLLGVLGVSDVAAAMQALSVRMNNGGSAALGQPDFSGLQIGDYLDLPSLVVGGTTYSWNDEYKNLRVVIAGLNQYKSAGDTENAKNHILFQFRNCVLNRQMNSSDSNTGGYAASTMKTYLDGDFKTGLEAALGMSLYSVRRLLSTKGGWAWASCTVFLPTEREVFGTCVWGEQGNDGGFQGQWPIYQSSAEYLVKRLNGARQWWWLAAPYSASAAAFCYVHANGDAGTNTASSAGGCAPAFCVA
jgi:hypothetical protein